MGELKLSAYEAEIAARPMTRGRAGADDLYTYIADEIVLSEHGGNDIYSDSASSDAVDNEEDALSLIHISEPTRLDLASRMPSSA